MTVSRTASQAVQTDLDNVSVLVKAGAVSETTATDSSGKLQHLKLKNMWRRQR
ncbi:hypothetical protein I5860_016995 [Clostridioides difficile]